MMKISVFGMGLMGTPIATKLAESKFEISVFNRTPGKLDLFKDKDFFVTTDVQEAIAHSEYLILTLGDAAAIEEVLFASEELFLQGKTIIQMGTIAPEESRDLAEKINQLSGKYLEAPVLGSIPQAKTGTLLVMAGGEQETFEECFPILQALGEKPMLIGDVGSAAALKLALNQLIAALTSGFSLSLGLIQKEGVDLEKFMGILRDSALYAPTFDKKLQRMCDRQFDNPNFPTKHLLKDTNLFLQAAKNVGLNTAGLQGIQTVIQEAITNNLENLDYSSIYNVIAPKTSGD